MSPGIRFSGEEMATVIGQLPGLQRRFLLSATDAEEIPAVYGAEQDLIELNFEIPEESSLAQRLHLYKVTISEKRQTWKALSITTFCTLGSQSTLVSVITVKVWKG